jgi:hypothetical protein
LQPELGCSGDDHITELELIEHAVGGPDSKHHRRTHFGDDLLKEVLDRQRGPAFAGFDPVLVEV